MSAVTAQHLERYDGSGALWTRLAMRYPAIEDRLRDAVFRPCYRFEFAVAQAGVHIDRLEEVLGPLSLDFLPDLPARAEPRASRGASRVRGAIRSRGWRGSCRRCPW